MAVKSAQRDEVTFAEAISGTMSGIFGHKRHKKDSGSHARHGDHARRRKDSMQSGDSNGMQTRIASASTAVASTDSLAETTVIAQDEMLAFAARFMQQHDDNSYLDDLGNVDDEFNEQIQKISNISGILRILRLREIRKNLTQARRMAIV